MTQDLRCQGLGPEGPSGCTSARQQSRPHSPGHGGTACPPCETNLSSPCRRGLCRLQEESVLRQQLLLQSDKLLRALRAELKVYEKLDQEQRRPRGTGHSGRACSPLHQQQAGPLSSNPRPASLVEQVDSEAGSPAHPPSEAAAGSREGLRLGSPAG